MTEAPKGGCVRNGLRWVVALIGTLGVLAFQDRTGPTYPMRGEYNARSGVVRYVFQRSQTIGSDLPILLRDPVPEGVRARVRYRRYRSRDSWAVAEMQRGTFAISQRGASEQASGLGAKLPSLSERAGKYEYFVDVIEGDGPPLSLTGGKPIYARYKASVPGWALTLHIVAIFGSFLLVIRTLIEAVIGGSYRRLMVASVLALLVGGFVLGPLVQWYAFGVWWSGVPFGYDWTDNKVVIELAAWLVALWTNRRGRRGRWAVIAAGVLTLVVYFVPHSIFGSEYNYVTGSGQGTAG